VVGWARTFQLSLRLPKQSLLGLITPLGWPPLEKKKSKRKKKKKNGMMKVLKYAVSVIKM
jgi:hypothetical protein